jgi:hypothetical protein
MTRTTCGTRSWWNRTPVTARTTAVCSTPLRAAVVFVASLADLDMLADAQVTGDQLPALAPFLLNSGVRILWDTPRREFKFPG